MPAHSIELLSRCVTAETAGASADAVPERQRPKLVQMNSGLAQGTGLASLGTDCLRRILSHPERLLASPSVWLKNELDHRVALIEAESKLTATALGDAMWCCKESISRRWWVPLLSRLVSLRSHNAFHQGLRLQQVGVATPQPLAVVGVIRGQAYHEYLLTEAVSGAVSLQQWCRQIRTREATPELWWERRIIARQLGLQLQRLHQQRFDHRDLKPSNILLSEATRVWLIDLDGVWRWPILPHSRRVQNLARMWAGLAGLSGVTATDALRFLLAYLPPQEHGSWKTLWRQVVRRAQQKISQKRASTATIQSHSFPEHGGVEHS